MKIFVTYDFQYTIENIGKYEYKRNLYSPISSQTSQSEQNKKILEKLQDEAITFKKLFIIVVNHNEIPKLFNVFKDNANIELYTSLKIIILLKIVLLKL